MNHLTDEILNKYIDNELDVHELNIVNEHIKVCEVCLQKLKAQKVVDTNLRGISQFKLPEGFTENMMQQIAVIRPASIHFKPQKSYLLRFIFLFLGLAILTFFILGLYEVSQSSSSLSLDKLFWYPEFLKKISVEVNSYSALFKSQTISLIGGIFTFILLISAYFIYDSHRDFKNRLNNLR
jgi:hypothetical protein